MMVVNFVLLDNTMTLLVPRRAKIVRLVYTVPRGKEVVITARRAQQVK